MKVLIIEDEIHIANALAAMLRRLRPECILVGITTGIEDSIIAISNNPDLDMVFSDIWLNDGLSFSVFDRVQTDAYVVFTTAYDEYALKAFDYNCIDYLLKPISENALERAISRFDNRSHHSQGIAVIKSMSEGILSFS